MCALHRNPLTGKPLSEERRLTLGLLLRMVVMISVTFLVSMIVAGCVVQRRFQQETLQAIEERSRSSGEAISSMMQDSTQSKLARAQEFIYGTAKDPLFHNLMVVASDTVIALAKDPADVAHRAIAVLVGRVQRGVKTSDMIGLLFGVSTATTYAI